MKYIVIEDERFAYNEIKRMMGKLRPDYELVGWAQGVEQAVTLLRQAHADLVFADIRLADGLCFDAFEQCHTNTPVIFTTAYDDYAIKAFKLNSVDYLLKPIDEGELSDALDKMEHNRGISALSDSYNQLAESYRGNTRKNRFLIHFGDEYRYVDTDDIAFFYSEDKATFLHTATGRRYVIDYSLDQLGPTLDSHLFFRASRGCIVNIKAITKVSRFFAGRLRLTLKPDCPQKVTVSRARANEFLAWLDDKR